VISEGDVWLVNFPLEEDPTEFLPRPVIVLNVELPYILSTKITKHDPRVTDPFDIPILHWKDANLNFPSTARVSKTIPLEISRFIHLIGNANTNDLITIQEMYTEFLLRQI
jgi:hypothetical protein